MDERKTEQKTELDRAPEEGAYYMVGPFQKGVVKAFFAAVILGVAGVWACALCLYYAVKVLGHIQLLLGK